MCHKRFLLELIDLKTLLLLVSGKNKMADLDGGGIVETKWKTLSLTHVEYPEGDKVYSRTHKLCNVKTTFVCI